MLAVILTAAIAVTGVFAYFYNMMQKATTDDGYFFADETEPEEEATGLDVYYENVDASSLDEYLTMWSTNGIKKLSDKNVINILLCGVDSTNGKATSGRSDAILLVSVNKKQKNITVTSFFRDSYTYIDLLKDAKNPRTAMNKVNAAYSWGGPATLIETLESNYKIVIDDYVSVDFQTFPKLIDALGGVTVDVTATEANYINRTAPSMHHKFPSGKNVTLTGAQALVYSRIRHLDNDMNRTARQRKVIMGILSAARRATTRQINNALNIALPYVVTSMSKMEITGMVTSALSQNWLDYPIVQNNTPTVETDDATGFSTYIRTQFVWVVDYPRAAQMLQNQIYGVTNIQLAAEGEERDDVLSKLFHEAHSSSGGGSSSKTTTQASTIGETVPLQSDTTEIEDSTEETTTTRSFFWWLTGPSAAPDETVAETEPVSEEETTVRTQTTVTETATKPGESP
jgi:LCP family protein required for cell wall assembly